MTPKALISLFALALVPALLPAASAQNPSKAKHEPNGHRYGRESGHGQTITSPAPPVVTPPSPVTGPVTPLPVVSMKMLTPTTGWASTGSQLFLTTDNGADWKDISPVATNGDLYAGVFFLDPQTGWLLTAHSGDFEDWTFAVWRTSNGGTTWASANLPRWHHDRRHGEPGLTSHGAITFANVRDGWLSLDLKGNTLFATSTLLATFDGGRTWDWAPAGPDAHISAMAATSTDALWTVGQAHGVSELDTNRGGFSFDTVSLPAPSQIAPNTIPTYTLPVFLDSRNGYEVVRYRSPNGATSAAVLFSTTNSGNTWKSDGILKNLIGSEDANSTLTGSAWILPVDPQGGSASLIELTPGVTSSLPAHQSGDFGRCTISFNSQAQGWSDCAGDLTATSNGGATWTEISPRINNGVLVSNAVSPSIAVPPLTFATPLTPATTPTPLTRTVSQHLGFDSAILPDPAKLAAWWQSSPYYDIGIYAPGSPNGPSDPALNASWVTTVSAQGWGIVPIWAGLQSPCGCSNPSSGPHAHDPYPGCHQFSSAQTFSIKPTQAEQQGEAQALAAYHSVKSLGLDGSIVYADIEPYDSSARDERNQSCSAATEAYVSGWVKGMHQNGGAGSAGVYGIVWDASPSQPQAADFQGADSVFLSRDDNRVTVWGLNHDSESQLDDTLWPTRQRIHQFRTGSQESWGGASLYIDSNVEDAPIAGGNNLKPIVPSTVTNVSFGPNSYLTGVADGANLGALVTGQAVGVTYTDGAWSDGTAFLWTPSKTSTTGGSTPLTYGTISTVPFAINNLGQVVGYYRNLSTDIGRGFLYTPGQGFTNLDVAGAMWTELYSINDAGWILGGYANSDYVAHCVLYKPPYTSPILFDDPGGACFSTSVNGLGQIAGAYPTDPSQTAFVPFVNDAQSSAPGNTANYQALSTPSPYTFPQGINNNGIVTGEDAAVSAGFFLDPRSSTSYALVNIPGTSESTLLGLNDTVQAAGWVYSTQVQGILLDTTH
jgi:probable HAF family extracellular repeat protein